MFSDLTKKISNLHFAAHITAQLEDIRMTDGNRREPFGPTRTDEKLMAVLGQCAGESRPEAGTRTSDYYGFPT
jgi:hypothetical protein